MVFAVIDYAAEIQTAAKSQLEAHAAFQVNGTLGVKTIEILYPRLGAETRDYSRAKCPAISVWTTGGESTWLATQTRGIDYSLHVAITVQRASTQVGSISVKKFQENVLAFLAEKIAYLSGTFLASGTQILLLERPSSEPFEQVGRLGMTRFRALGTIPVRVLVRVAPD